MACLTPAGAESSFVIAAACCQSGSIVRTLLKSKVNPDLVLSIILRKVQEAQSKHCPNLPWINLWLDLDWISRNHPNNHSTGAPPNLTSSELIWSTLTAAQRHNSNDGIFAMQFAKSHWTVTKCGHRSERQLGLHVAVKEERGRFVLLLLLRLRTRLQFCPSRFSLLRHMEYSARQWRRSAWNAMSAVLPPLWVAAQG